MPSRDEDIDEAVVRKVGEKRAVPLLPQDDDEGKELVIHVPEETAKSTEIGVLSTLVILILIASAVAVAYFVYDRKRQKKIKECVDKLQKTEEGQRLTGEKNEPSPPAPFPASDDTSSLTPLQSPEDDTTATVTSEEPAFFEGEPEPVTDDTNNNRNRNAKKSKRLFPGRRCCMCFCCPPLKDPSSVGEVWQLKKAQLKFSDDADAQHSLRLMAEGMKQMKGHHHLHTPSSTRLTPNPRRRHRKSHKRSQSLPAPSKKSTPKHISWDHNRSCWSQAAVLKEKKRSQSVSPGQSRHPQADVRQHRHGGAHRSRREGLEQQHKSSRSCVQEQPQRHCSSRSKSSGRRRGDTAVGDQPRGPSYMGDGWAQHNENQHRQGFYPHGSGYRYYFKDYHPDEDKHKQSHRQRSRSRSRVYEEEDRIHRQGCPQQGRVQSSNRQAEPQRYRDREQVCAQTHHTRKPQPHKHDPQQRHGRDHCARHQCVSGKIPAHYCHTQLHDRQKVYQSGRVESLHSQNDKYCDSEQSQEQFRDIEGQNSRLKVQDSIHKRYLQHHPGHQSYRVQRNVEESPSLCREGSGRCSQNAGRHQHSHHRHQPSTGNGENKNQSAYWPNPDSHSTPRFPPQFHHHHHHQQQHQQQHAKRRHAVTRTIPNTDSPEESLCSGYNHYPTQYQYHHGRLNVSQNYNCEDTDHPPSQINCSASCASSSRKRAEDGSGDQNDELSDNDGRNVRRKVCRKRSARPRFRKALAQLKSFPRAIKRKGQREEGSDVANVDWASSTSSDSSQGKGDTLSLAKRLFGLKLSSAKRPKRQQHKRVKKKKRSSQAVENRPLLGDNTSWDSEDTTYEASKGTEPVDSGYVVSTSLPSDANRSDLTVTHQSPLNRTKTIPEETPIISLSNDNGFDRNEQQHTRIKACDETASTDFDKERHKYVESFRLKDFKDYMSEMKSNNNSVSVSVTGHESPNAQHQAKRVAFKHLGAKSSTDKHLACLDSFSNDDQREFRKLATQKWCEQQWHSRETPSQNPCTSVRTRDEDWKENSFISQLTTSNSPVFSKPLTQPEMSKHWTQREEHSSVGHGLHDSPQTCAFSTGGNPVFCPERDRSTGKADEEVTMEMDHLDFMSPIFSSNTATHSSQANQNTDFNPLDTSVGESSDLFDKLARDRLHCHECKQEFVHDRSHSASHVSAADASAFSTMSPSGHPQRTEQSNLVEKLVPKAGELSIPSFSQKCVDSQVSSSQHRRNSVPQRECRLSPLPTSPADKGHLSASILPPQFLFT